MQLLVVKQMETFPIRVTKERERRFFSIFNADPEALNHPWIKKTGCQLLSPIPPPSAEAVRDAPEHYDQEAVAKATIVGFCRYIPRVEEGWTMINLILALPTREGSWFTQSTKFTDFLNERLSTAAKIIVNAAFDASPSCNFTFNIPREFLQENQVADTDFVACQALPGYFGGYLGLNVAVYLGRDNHGNVSPFLEQSMLSRGPPGKELIDLLEVHYGRHEFPWIKVDPGRRSGQSKRPVVGRPLPEQLVPLHPKYCEHVRIRYQQVAGEFKCYIGSFASAVAELGLLSESRAIHKEGCSKPEFARTNDFIHRVVEKHFRGKYQFRRCRKKNRFNPLSCRCPHLTVVLLKQRQKEAYPHCVTFYKDMIFDSSFKFALKRSRDNLDYICGGKGNYVGVWWAKQLLLVPPG